MAQFAGPVLMIAGGLFMLAAANGEPGERQWPFVVAAFAMVAVGLLLLVVG